MLKKFLLCILLVSGCYSTSGVTHHGTRWQLGQQFATRDFNPVFSDAMEHAAYRYQEQTGIKIPVDVYDKLDRIEVYWHGPLNCSALSGSCGGLFNIENGRGVIKVYKFGSLEHELMHYLMWRVENRHDPFHDHKELFSKFYEPKKISGNDYLFGSDYEEN